MDSNNLDRPRFSICIPAYNRARFLTSLLDSVLSQSYQDFEIVICEDQSPEREEIRAIATDYISRHPARVRYLENEKNLGYDGNIRELIARSRGTYCFFLGNDDLMCADALEHLQELLERHPDAGFVIRAYACFSSDPEHPEETIRYFNEEREFDKGIAAIRIAFRRSGVISGYIVHRDTANAAATSRFDGTLYYQMHVTGYTLLTRTAVSTPLVLVLCRSSTPPDFGHAESEKRLYTPGRYTPQARLHMIEGVLAILQSLQESSGLKVADPVMKDYANYFYAYIRDQLYLPIPDLWRLYRAFGAMGFDRFPLFHIHFLAGALLGERQMDSFIRLVRQTLKRSPQLGI